MQQDADQYNFFSWVDEDIDVGATEIGRIEPIPDFGLRLRLEILQREVRMLTYCVVVGFVVVVFLILSCNHKYNQGTTNREHNTTRE